MRSAPTGKVLANGSMSHEDVSVRGESPEESKGPWDYYKLLAKIPG